MNNPNFWIYANKEEQEKTAASLIVFGAEVFKRAKAIKEINLIRSIKHDLDNKTIHPKNTNASEFVFEFLIDCIRFLVFFENYMKAELILKDYCVHCIDSSLLGFKELAKQQKKRPIELKEIHKIENFFVDPVNHIINHPAILDKTIGIKELTASEKYFSNYEFDNSMKRIVSQFNTYRNKLHFNDSLELLISDDFLSNLTIMNDFVDRILRNRIKHNAP